ncbi:hypothetical protein EMCG_04643 [[Emmonsia] crescens]|uniref:Isochorismatase-like domain-containing protein n=1 Tax=[Emmonsia] crescens TaxID=73230 RepID=A0A0G2J798_9EURO|nr:hypothetical protein EMCG_04643 [Emmonsia crescens UAMH 3008]
MLRERGTKQLVIAGVMTEHCGSTSVRMAANLEVVGEAARVLLVEHACTAWAKVGSDAETVYGVSVECFRGEFAEVMETVEVVGAVGRLNVNHKT